MMCIKPEFKEISVAGEEGWGKGMSLPGVPWVTVGLPVPHRHLMRHNAACVAVLAGVGRGWAGLMGQEARQVQSSGNLLQVTFTSNGSYFRNDTFCPVGSSTCLPPCLPTRVLGWGEQNGCFVIPAFLMSLFRGTTCGLMEAPLWLETYEGGGREGWGQSPKALLATGHLSALTGEASGPRCWSYGGAGFPQGLPPPCASLEPGCPHPRSLPCVS